MHPPIGNDGAYSVITAITAVVNLLVPSGRTSKVVVSFAERPDGPKISDSLFSKFKPFLVNVLTTFPLNYDQEIN